LLALMIYILLLVVCYCFQYTAKTFQTRQASGEF
jgi:hypothetical protein